MLHRSKINPYGFFRDSMCSKCIMRFGNDRYRLLFAALLLAGMIPSCKSPISTTQSSAFTLILPDSAVAWGDSALMRVVPSMPLDSSSIYTWSFGDSSTLLSRKDTIIHYYLNPGDFTVKVDLNDTSNHQSLGTQSGTVHVVARHFDLALLQSMIKMDIIVHSPFSESNALNLCQPPNIFLMDTPFVVELPFADSTLRLSNEFISWNQTGFSQSTKEDDTGFQSEKIIQDSVYTNTDSLLSKISYTESQYGFLWYQAAGPGSPFCRQEEWDQISLTDIPFVSESDTDVVFELDGEASHSCQVTAKGTSSSIGDSTTFSVQANWNNFSYVIIRFHK